MEPDRDVLRLAEVLRLCREHLVAPAAITVGDIKIAFAGRLPPPRPITHASEQAKAVAEDKAVAESTPDLAELRERAQTLLGHVPPDAVLSAMVGVL